MESRSLRKYAFFEELIGKRHSQCRIANDDGGDGTFAGPGVEAKRLEPALEETGVLPQLVHQIRLGSITSMAARQAAATAGG